MITEELYSKYMHGLLAGNRRVCHDVVTSLLDQDIDIKDLYVHLFQRSLYKVGELWETNQISVATEHIATAITEGVLSLIYPKIFEADHTGQKAVIACVPNEFHQIGAKMVADTFELNGWDGHFVGANTPTHELMKLIRENDPDVIALSLSIYFNLSNFEKMITEIRAEFPETPIWVGGQAFRWGGEDVIAKFQNTQFINSLHAMERKLHTKELK
jgi:methanogenic corrinoid protein MtbC1